MEVSPSVLQFRYFETIIFQNKRSGEVVSKKKCNQLVYNKDEENTPHNEITLVKNTP